MVTYDPRSIVIVYPTPRGKHMASPKLDAVNQFISATKKTFDLLRSAAQDVEEGVSQTEVMRRITRAQLDLVKAAHALSATPSDPEADKAAGAVLLERISRAVAVKTMGEWGAAADVAIENAGPDFADELAGNEGLDGSRRPA